MKLKTKQFLLMILMFVSPAFASEPAPPTPCVHQQCQSTIATIAQEFNQAGNLNLGSYALGPATCYSVNADEGGIYETDEDNYGLVYKVGSEYHIATFTTPGGVVPSKWNLEIALKTGVDISNPAYKLQVFDTYSMLGYSSDADWAKAWIRQSGNFVYTYDREEGPDYFHMCKFPVVVE